MNYSIRLSKQTPFKMNQKIPYLQLFIFFLLLFSISCQQKITALPKADTAIKTTIQKTALSPLEAYVKAKDDAFEYKLVNEIKAEGYTTYVIRMVSQKWLTTKEVKDPIWWHWLTIIVPEGATTNKGMLFIDGGSHTTKQPTKADAMLLEVALGTQSVVANLHNIPNQPIIFQNDAYGPRVEDELIAFGWRQFLEGGAKKEDAEWLARFPMTKAAVRAMDVVSTFTAENTPKKVEEFVVAGASKRGWTTWTTAIVDNRVIAIVPIVIDMLNMIPSFNHHWRVYGKWAAAIGDYQLEGIMEWQNSQEYQRLAELTEPYNFKKKLTLPKLLLNATGDQFFIPDSWQFYWKDLLGEKHLRYVPNSEHSMGGTDAIESLVAFHQMILANQDRPDFDWEVMDGTIHIQTKPAFQPLAITLWQAYNPKARNFQVDEIGRAYTSTTIPLSADGKYQVQIKKPTEGWAAFFVEMTFAGVGIIPLKMSTGVVVTPDVYPYEDYHSKNPIGTSKK